MRTELHRATDNASDAESIPAGSCWTPDHDTAVAYSDNPGFGGSHIISITVDSDRVLDVRGRDARDLSRLAAALSMDAATWLDDGLDSVFAVIENRRSVRSTLSNVCDWVVYLDDYPENAITWRKC